MSQLVLTRGIKPNRGVFGRMAAKIQMGPYFLVVSLVVFVALITVITLMYSARQVTKGYMLNQLEAEYQSLLRENETQDMQISTVRSLSFIEESNQVRYMTKPGQIVYVHSETAIASR